MSNEGEYWIARLKDEQPLSQNDRLQIAAELFATRASLDLAHTAMEQTQSSDKPEPPEALASRLIDAWCMAHGKQIPWAKAVGITAILTKMPDVERDRLLAMD